VAARPSRLVASPQFAVWCVLRRCASSPLSSIGLRDRSVATAETPLALLGHRACASPWCCMYPICATPFQLFYTTRALAVIGACWWLMLSGRVARLHRRQTTTSGDAQSRQTVKLRAPSWFPLIAPTPTRRTSETTFSRCTHRTRRIGQLPPRTLATNAPLVSPISAAPPSASTSAYECGAAKVAAS